VVSKREVVPQDERAPESCLHCEINDLVQEHVKGLEEPVDIVAVAANIVESLVDLILLAPEEEQAKVLAVTIGHLGQTFLEKSGRLKRARIRRIEVDFSLSGFVRFHRCAEQRNKTERMPPSQRA
jgi:hypothetical protein